MRGHTIRQQFMREFRGLDGYSRGMAAAVVTSNIVQVGLAIIICSKIYCFIN